MILNTTSFLHTFRLSLILFLILPLSFCVNMSARVDAEPLSPEAFKEKMETDTDAVVIDVRTAKEFSEGHVPEAINFNVNDESFAEKISTLDTSGTYMLYCRTGNRTLKAEEMMREAGITHIYQMKGGFPDWKEKGYPVKEEQPLE